MAEDTAAEESPAPENKATEAVAGRLPNGQLAKGVSGNPGGRPKGHAEFLDLVRLRAPLAVYKLVEIMTKGRGSAQVKAAEIIIEHAYGKPRQRIEATGAGGKDLIPSRDDAINALRAVLPAVAAAADQKTEE